MTALYQSGRRRRRSDAYQDARRDSRRRARDRSEPGAPGARAAILRQDPSLDVAAPPDARHGVVAERSILVAVADGTGIDALLAVAEPLVRAPRIMVLARLVPDAADLGRPLPGSKEAQVRARNARHHDARSLVHVDDAGEGAGQAGDRVRRRPPAHRRSRPAPGRRGSGRRAHCLTSRRRQATSRSWTRSKSATGAVLVPFGGADHDWAAVELGAWFARATTLRLAGATAVPEQGKRDASRLLSHGALAVQRVLGIPAEPLLTPPGDEGMLEASHDAGLLVVGLSTRWHHEGLGLARLRLARDEVPHPRCWCARPAALGGLAPPAALTRFTWSIRP